jgi:hypothetical protein
MLVVLSPLGYNFQSSFCQESPVAYKRNCMQAVENTPEVIKEASMAFIE